MSTNDSSLDLERQYEQYIAMIPEVKRSKLQCDIESNQHIRRLAKKMIGWEEKWHLFDLSDSTLRHIKASHSKPAFQQIDVLNTWRMNCPDITYEYLLRLFIEGEFIDCAKELVAILSTEEIQGPSAWNMEDTATAVHALIAGRQSPLVPQMPQITAADEELLPMIDSSELDINSLGCIQRELKQKMSSKWQEFAVQLGLNYDITETIRVNNPKDAALCLQEAMASWLQLNYDLEKYGRPSWQKIAEVVMHFSIDLFRDIAKKHGKV